MKIIKAFCTKNNRYRGFEKMKPRGLMLHSVGCSQPKAEVFVKTWNKPNKFIVAHAVLQEDGTVYQCLPWDYKGWHAGGSANETHIGVEMTEPECIKYTKGPYFTCSNLVRAREQAKGAYETAVELFAFLCKEYDLNPLTDIISHAEGHRLGVASNHGDPTHLWQQLGLKYSMDGFREDVLAKLKKSTATTSNNLATASKLKNGTAVKLIKGATYYDGKRIPDWLFKTTLYVRQVNGDRVVVSTLKTGPVTGAVARKYLK